MPRGWSSEQLEARFTEFRTRFNRGGQGEGHEIVAATQHASPLVRHVAQDLAFDRKQDPFGLLVSDRRKLPGVDLVRPTRRCGIPSTLVVCVQLLTGGHGSYTTWVWVRWKASLHVIGLTLGVGVGLQMAPGCGTGQTCRDLCDRFETCVPDDSDDDHENRRDCVDRCRTILDHQITESCGDQLEAFYACAAELSCDALSEDPFSFPGSLDFECDYQEYDANCTVEG